MLNDNITQIIHSNSINLEQFGINSLCWTKANAIEMLDKLMKHPIGVLGEDVYILNGSIEPLAENWSCEQNSVESKKHFYLRSKAASIKYIDQFPVDDDENIVFAIVFTDAI